MLTDVRRWIWRPHQRITLFDASVLVVSLPLWLLRPQH
ncbi:MAG: hypothetical protein ACJATT_005031 [Myxococcota bacterium]